MAGGYVVYYYTYTAWDVLRPDDNPTGYTYMKRLRDFFEQTGYWKLQPADALVSASYCLANPGREYVVFLPQAKPFTLKLDGLSQPLSAQWYHPLRGQHREAGRVHNDVVTMQAPADWGDGPVALHVRMEGIEAETGRRMLTAKLITPMTTNNPIRGAPATAGALNMSAPARPGER